MSKTAFSLAFAVLLFSDTPNLCSKCHIKVVTHPVVAQRPQPPSILRGEGCAVKPCVSDCVHPFFTLSSSLTSLALHPSSSLEGNLVISVPRVGDVLVCTRLSLILADDTLVFCILG